MGSSQDEVYGIMLRHDRPMTCREIMNEIGIQGKSAKVYTALYQLEKFQMVRRRDIPRNERNELRVWEVVR